MRQGKPRKSPRSYKFSSSWLTPVVAEKPYRSDEKPHRSDCDISKVPSMMLTPCCYHFVPLCRRRRNGTARASIDVTQGTSGSARGTEKTGVVKCRAGMRDRAAPTHG